MITTQLYRATVENNWSVMINDKPYQVLRTLPGVVPAEPFDNLLDILGKDVIIEGILQDDKIHVVSMMLVEDYQPSAPPTIHRQGTTLHPVGRKNPLNWRGKWSMTHAIEPPPQENPPWNAPINRYPKAILRINDFLDVEHNPRYEPRDEWTCCTVFVSDFTRMMHCEICLDPAGSTKWYNRNANWMVKYIHQICLVRDGWRLVVSARGAQTRANQGYPVVAFKADPAATGHVAMVIPGQLDENGLPLLANAGRINAKAWRWADPAVQYVTHD
jgi:hypothetical protein